MCSKPLIAQDSANWLNSVISWALSWEATPQGSSISQEVEDEVFTSMHKLQAIYRDVHMRDGFVSTSTVRHFEFDHENELILSAA